MELEEGSKPMPSEAEQVVERMVRAYERGDLDEMLDCFTEDAVYHPMLSIPSRNAGRIERVEGKPAIRKMVSEWFTFMTLTGIEIHQQMSDRVRVMHERTDRSIIRGQEGMTPVAAVFDMENGLISVWREYFDMPDMPDT
jgi:limonene-1,2-epoxide hydrolase